MNILAREFDLLDESLSLNATVQERLAHATARDDLLIEKLQQKGFSLIRKQVWKDLDGNEDNTNIYVVLPALRGDHTEAMLVGAPKSNLQGNFLLFFVNVLIL